MNDRPYATVVCFHFAAQVDVSSLNVDVQYQV